MIYGSWDKEWDKRNFLSFWVMFCPFTHYQSTKSKFWKNEKHAWRYYFTHVYHTWQSYHVWFLRYEGEIFLSFWTIFCSFTPLTTQKIKILKKKTPGDIIKCTIHENDNMHGSWDMEGKQQNFLSCWTVFCPFTPLATQKIKILNKWKKDLEILPFYTSIP